MMGRITAVVLTVVGAGALVLSAFQPWYEGQDPRGVPLTRLFTGLEPGDGSSAVTSMLLPLAAAAALGVLALLLRARSTMILASLVGLATGVLWTVQQARAVAPVAFEVTDLQRGVWNAAGGVLLLLIATAVMQPRRS